MAPRGITCSKMLLLRALQPDTSMPRKTRLLPLHWRDKRVITQQMIWEIIRSTVGSHCAWSSLLITLQTELICELCYNNLPVSKSLSRLLNFTGVSSSMTVQPIYIGTSFILYTHMFITVNNTLIFRHWTNFERDNK